MAKDTKNDYLVVRYDASSMEDPVSIQAFETWRFRAHSADDVYFYLVMNDICYSFYSQVHFWANGWDQSFLKPIFDPLPTTLKNELKEAMTNVEKGESGWVTAEQIKSKLPRAWITPSIAQQLWTIYNDAGDGRTQDAAPYKHRQAAQLLELGKIPSVTIPLSLPSDSKVFSTN